jgi:DNA-binding GntR family transcriptional regulator
MDYLQSADPVAIAMEHLPIADALASDSPDLAASLLASHSNHLVDYLKKEQRKYRSQLPDINQLTF